MKKIILFGIAIAIISVSLISGCLGGDDNGEEEEQLEVAPDFELTSIDGDDFTLSDYLGRVVILDFMFTTCQHCDDEMGELKKVYSHYDENDVVIITIDILPGEDNETELRNFGETYGDDWIYALDTDNVNTKYDDYIDGYPTVVIVNKEGKIACNHSGLTEYNTLSSEIDKLL